MLIRVGAPRNNTGNFHTQCFDSILGRRSRTTASGHTLKILSINLPRRYGAPAGSAERFKSLVPACSRTTFGRDGSELDA